MDTIRNNDNRLVCIKRRRITMIDMKCPFCQQELQEDVGYDGDYSCPNCTESYFGSPELWQELIRTRKALDVALNCLNGVVKDLPWVKRTLDEITALEQK